MRFRKFLKPYKTRGSSFREHTPTQGVTHVCDVIRIHFKISIHTPTQGVTWYRDELPETKHISIHTPRVVSETH